jgi:hypothetical protein
MPFNARLIGGQVNIILTKESDFLRDVNMAGGGGE